MAAFSIRQSEIIRYEGTLWICALDYSKPDAPVNFRCFQEPSADLPKGSSLGKKIGIKSTHAFGRQ